MKINKNIGIKNINIICCFVLEYKIVLFCRFVWFKITFFKHQITVATDQLLCLKNVGFFPSWIGIAEMCFLTNHFKVALFSQISHLYGFFPSWTLHISSRNFSKLSNLNDFFSSFSQEPLITGRGPWFSVHMCNFIFAMGDLDMIVQFFL